MCTIPGPTRYGAAVASSATAAKRRRWAACRACMSGSTTGSLSGAAAPTARPLTARLRWAPDTSRTAPRSCSRWERREGPLVTRGSLVGPPRTPRAATSAPAPLTSAARSPSAGRALSAARDSGCAEDRRGPLRGAVERRAPTAAARARLMRLAGFLREASTASASRAARLVCACRRSWARVVVGRADRGRRRGRDRGLAAPALVPAARVSARPRRCRGACVCAGTVTSAAAWGRAGSAAPRWSLGPVTSAAAGTGRGGVVAVAAAPLSASAPRRACVRQWGGVRVLSAPPSSANSATGSRALGCGAEGSTSTPLADTARVRGAVRCLARPVAVVVPGTRACPLGRWAALVGLGRCGGLDLLCRPALTPLVAAAGGPGGAVAADTSSAEARAALPVVPVRRRRPLAAGLSGWVEGSTKEVERRSWRTALRPALAARRRGAERAGRPPRAATPSSLRWAPRRGSARGRTAGTCTPCRAGLAAAGACCGCGRASWPVCSGEGGSGLVTLGPNEGRECTRTQAGWLVAASPPPPCCCCCCCSRICLRLAFCEARAGHTRA